MIDEKEYIHLPSGRLIVVSSDVYYDYFSNFTEYQYYYFNLLMGSALYFPQIVQFVCVMIWICNGHTSFGDVFLSNLVSGVVFTFTWFFLKLHKFIPGICSLSCFVGGNIFRYKLHFVAIAIVSIFVIGDWKIILYCAVCGFVSGAIRSLLVGALSTVRYNDAAVIYSSHFKN